MDLLVLGTPDRETLYDAVNVAERRLGRDTRSLSAIPDGWKKDQARSTPP